MKLVADRREQYCTDKNDKGCRIYFVDSGTAAIDKNISVCLKSSGKNKPLNIQASLKVSRFMDDFGIIPF